MISGDKMGQNRGAKLWDKMGQIIVSALLKAITRDMILRPTRGLPTPFRVRASPFREQIHVNCGDGSIIAKFADGVDDSNYPQTKLLHRRKQFRKNGILGGGNVRAILRCCRSMTIACCLVIPPSSKAGGRV